MKKLIYFAGAFLLFTCVSCKKSTEGNTSILVTDSGLTKSEAERVVADSTTDLSQKYTERYVADDGSSALVTFDNSGAEKMISISSNKMTIKAPQTEAWAKGGIYEDHDYKITAKNDSVTIIQGNNVITLKKARGN